MRNEALYRGGKAPIGSADELAKWFLLFVAGIWLGGISLLSLAGGWHRLASRFRAASRIDGETFRFTSMYIRAGPTPVGYAGCLFITVNPSGLRVSILFLFRLLHPPLFIPWSAVETILPEEVWSMPFTAVRLRGSDIRLLFTEPVGRKIAAVYNTRYSTMPA